MPRTFKNQYTLKQKLEYYSNRVNDSSLSDNQREYALGWTERYKDTKDLKLERDLKQQYPDSYRQFSKTANFPYRAGSINSINEQLKFTKKKPKK